MAARESTVRRLAQRRLPYARPRSTSSREAILYLAGDTGSLRPRASREEAVQYPPFERCLDLIAGSLANLDIRAGVEDPATSVWMRRPDAEQPAFLTDPDPENDPWQWRYSVVRDLLEYGNHIALLGDIDWRTMRPGWALPLPAEHLGVVHYGWNPYNADQYGWDYVYGGMILRKDEILHIKRGGLSGEVLGRGLVDQFARSLRVAITAEEWAGRYLEGGGVPPAVVQSTATIDKPKRDELKAAWRAMLVTGEAMLLPANVTVTPLVSDAQRQQLVEARQWNAHLACQMTGVPSHKLGLEGPSMTYQNVETADIAWRIDTLDRYGQPVVRSIDKHLMPRGWTCRWQYAQTERTDIRTQAEVTAALVTSGLLTVDEGRQRLQYPPMAVTTQQGATPAGVPEPGAQEV
jgi:phage portal protein BeeE